MVICRHPAYIRHGIVHHLPSSSADIHRLPVVIRLHYYPPPSPSAIRTRSTASLSTAITFRYKDAIHCITIHCHYLPLSGHDPTPSRYDPPPFPAIHHSPLPYRILLKLHPIPHHLPLPYTKKPAARMAAPHHHHDDTVQMRTASLQFRCIFSRYFDDLLIACHLYSHMHLFAHPLIQMHINSHMHLFAHPLIQMRINSHMHLFAHPLIQMRTNSHMHLSAHPLIPQLWPTPQRGFRPAASDTSDNSGRAASSGCRDRRARRFRRGP